MTTTVKLGNIVKINSATYSPNMDWDYINYLDTGNLTENVIDSVQWINLSKDKLPSRARRMVKYNSILYSTVRPNQRHYGIIKNQPTNFLVSTGFAVIDVDENKADPDFIYFYLTQDSIIETLQNIAEQNVTTYPSITASSIENMQIKLPPLSIQKKIAGVLKNISDKMSLNMQINQNLDKQAVSIFSEYFITQDFPIELETTLGVICACELGGTPDRSNPDYWNGFIPWINSGEINRFRITSPSEYITVDGFKHSSTKLLPAKTTVIAITGATLGQVSLLEIESCANQSVVGVIPNNKLPYEFIYPFINANIQELASHQTGGAQQHINKNNIESLKISIPQRKYLNDYQQQVAPIYSLIAKNCFENETLAKLRNLILPKLMSGEIDISELDI